jgi:hypothetical protein
MIPGASSKGAAVETAAQALAARDSGFPWLRVVSPHRKKTDSIFRRNRLRIYVYATADVE